MKKLIVNGDDFGLSIGANKGIIEAFQKGILTSTTLFTNMAGFEDAVIQAKKNPYLGVGIHLNLTWGKPVSPIKEIFHLVNSNGYFEKSLGKLYIKLYLNKIDPKQIQMELNAQIEKFLAYGLKPTHIDTHQHIILFPKVYHIILGLMHKYRIIKLRFYQPSKSYFSDNCKFIKKIMIYLVQGKSKNNMFHSPDYIFDLENVALKERLFQAKDGINEIISHPAYIDADIRKFSRILSKREEELNEITHPSTLDIIKSLKILLTNYEKF